MWASIDGRGFEHLRLTVDDDVILADGLVIGADDAGSFRVRYLVRCDGSWRTRSAELEVLDAGRGIALASDGDGRWRTTTGERLGMLEGCIDVDISTSVFTNSLPIRRLRLASGGTADLRVAYLDAPSLAVGTSRQRYTCLESSERGGRYRFESLDGTFVADLAVDREGLVLDYPQIRRRVWSK
jgi:uncharacterized protein